MRNSPKHVKDWRNNTKQRMLQAMGGQCVCCGYSRCADALEFHHLDSREKEFGLGKTRANPTKWIKIVEELRKCVLVCSICHREVHAGIREVPVDAVRFDESYVNYRAEKFVSVMDDCPICGQPKDLSRKTCSRRCAGKARYAFWKKANPVKNARSRPPMIRWDSIDLSVELQSRTFEDIAQQLNCSPVTVWKRAHKLGMRQKLPSIWDGHDLASLMQTMSMNKISRLVGCSEMAVRKRVAKLNLGHLVQYKRKAT